MHIHLIEQNGELVDVISFCSDACHKAWCAEEGETYGGWHGAEETEHTDYCQHCGTVLPGQDACDCQMNNVVVNRFLSQRGEKCQHGNWLQVPKRFINR